MNKQEIVLTALLAASALVAAGCASKEVVKHEEPQVQAEATPAPTQAPAPEKVKYDVKKGDSLWKISSGGSIYGDPFEWPLLFKANRDQIQDPDIIETNQELEVNKDFTQAQTDDAIQKAKDTPPFRQHAKPREKLPLMY